MDAAQFETHAAHEQKHWWFVARRQILSQVLLELAPPGSPLLDVGCGTGANAAWFAEQFPTTGIDVSRYAIELARQRFPQVRFACGTIEDIEPETCQQIRLVTLLDVLEHVPDDLQVFSQLLSRITLGTHVVVTVPAGKDLWSPHDQALGHYRRYSAERLSLVWKGLPVECRLLTHFNARLYGPIRLVRSLTRKRQQSAGHQGTDLALPPKPINAALRYCFAGEAKRIVRSLQRGGAGGYAHGVSLLAVLKRTEGEVRVRTRSPEVPGDYYDPITKRYLED
ncbi:class I SAM-dependent methyltransferase [Bremerella cremea]|uniref:Class I SAM-dependent methyltransferase n=1 Tax=Bremerella cremea TaxID=1031537 RepID=A0A368KVG8_9BACT|nr:class I SAM-dependent methyltransferase [Bremerella cremea]RCS54296.1 class I SAM-dependent methyltransferase [Bremerella cremea]